eukprot:1392752-Amorphochlora_amoeboformis.AAC.1
MSAPEGLESEAPTQVGVYAGNYDFVIRFDLSEYLFDFLAQERGRGQMGFARVRAYVVVRTGGIYGRIHDPRKYLVRHISLRVASIHLHGKYTCPHDPSALDMLSYALPLYGRWWARDVLTSRKPVSFDSVKGFRTARM